MIIVVNKRTHTPTMYDVYIGRPSPLGNPYSVATFGRDRCIDLYRDEFEKMISTKANTEHFNYALCRIQLTKIWDLHRKGIVNLVCYCAPLACHGDVLKEFLESVISGK